MCQIFVSLLRIKQNINFTDFWKLQNLLVFQIKWGLKNCLNVNGSLWLQVSVNTWLKLRKYVTVV